MDGHNEDPMEALKSRLFASTAAGRVAGAGLASSSSTQSLLARGGLGKGSSTMRNPKLRSRLGKSASTASMPTVKLSASASLHRLPVARQQAALAETAEDTGSVRPADARHALLRHRKEEKKLQDELARQAILEIAAANAGFRAETLDGAEADGDEGTAPPPAALSDRAADPLSFLGSLKLSNAQLRRFIDDSGSFLYLQRRPAETGGEASVAYNLQVIEHHEIDPMDYCTLSVSGLTHFTNGDSDFTPLAAWEREFSLFYQMRSLPFFAKYRKWKTFCVWKKNVTSGKMANHGADITRELFLFNPSLRVALMKVRELCVEVSNMRLLSIKPGTTYALHEFIEAQHDLQANLTVRLGHFSHNVLVTVRTACDEIVDSFLRGSRITADHKMTFMERASLRSECRKLTRFLRLTDFIVVDTLRTLALDSVADTVHAFSPASHVVRVVRTEEVVKAPEEAAILGMDDDGQPTEPALVPLLRLEVSFQDSGELALRPTLPEIKEGMQRIISQSLKVIGIPERVFTHDELSAYVMSEADEGAEGDATRDEVPVQEIVVADEDFVSTTDTIHTHLEAAYGGVVGYTECFLPFKEVYMANDQATGDMAAAHGSDVDLPAFRAEIRSYQDQVDSFQAIPSSAELNIFYCDSNALKQRLLPSPVACLDALKTLLPQLIGQHADRLLEDLGKAVPVVQNNPNTVEKFIRKQQVVAECLVNMDSFKAQQDKLNAMSGLMEEFKWAMPEEQRAHRVMVDSSMSNLESGIQVAEGQEEEDAARFAEEVDKEVPELRKRIVGLRSKLDSAVVADANGDVRQTIAYLQTQSDELDRLRADATQLQDQQTALKRPIDEYDALDEATIDLNLKTQVWKGLDDWGTLTAAWSGTVLTEIDVEEFEKTVAQYTRTVFKASKGLPNNPIVPKLKGWIDEFVPLVPIVANLRNPTLKPRHWKQLNEMTGVDIQNDQAFQVGDILKKGVVKFEEQITSIATSAQQEAVLEEMMDKVNNIWNVREFEVKPYKDIKDLYILGDVSDLMGELDDSLVTVNTVLGSRYVGGIREAVDTMRSNLIMFQDTLDEWLSCQRAWMYLETIFSSPDIVRQLPKAAKSFFIVDKAWKKIMKALADDPLALPACIVKDRREQFQNHNAALDTIQKNLEDYLETKRGAFARFYFLSNDELLEILSSSKDPQAVQPHLRKCFEALTLLDFGSEAGSVDVLAMYSAEKERVPLGKNLKARGNVEDWLSQVEARMRSQLKVCMWEGLKDYDKKPRVEWVRSHPGQVVATVAQMTWARGTEVAFKAVAGGDSEAMTKWHIVSVEDLDQLINLIRQDLSKIHRKIIVALVTTDVHARDILELLRDAKVDKAGNFTWQQQLRYYWQPDVDDCVISHSDAKINYGYEYMGATSRLVITPLTDRCWLTLTGSYGLKLGGSPAGPAGTGKTESSKDLAKAMGIFCIVFNCSDQIDYIMMGKLFRGLAQASCWTCLDEFNRIDIEVLSVIAQQLVTLREGRLAGKSHINFMGFEIVLNDHHVIITMNPGYAGRTELPDNLQICFRPVAMMVPNYALIAEIMLFAEGFSDAKNLSRKMCKLYILCSEQLSQQPHYDYGLRAVKSVLVMAGSLKREAPDVLEDLTLIRALRDSNVPKFLADDLPLFFAIVQDLFPGMVAPTVDYGELQVALEEELDNAGLQKEPGFIKKVIQMFDIFEIRFGATLVGPTGTGKSTCYKILAALMSNLRAKGSTNPAFQKVHIEILNPKCITMGELYGEINVNTQEWTDGLASTMMRRAVGTEGDDKRWTVFDGPIDALWIENMNTVLDDNMTLCLANGERIKLKPEMRMLFEVMDLSVASPATVSRIGVVFVTPSDLGWKPYVATWNAMSMPEATPQKVREHVLALFYKAFQPMFNYIKKNCSEPVDCVDIQLATSCAKIFESLFSAAQGVDFSAAPDVLERIAEKIFAFSLIWSVGGTINASGWDGFSDTVRETLDECGLGRIGLPARGVVFDYFFDVKDNEFKEWNTVVDKFSYDPNMSYFDMVVPTVDTVRYSYIMSKCLTINKPVFMTGDTGTGKTVIVAALLRSLEPPAEEGGMGLLPVFINFSAQTLSLVTQMTIEGKLEKKRKNLLGAPVNRKVVVFVDDVNMPFVQTYGAQAPIELLRQFCDHKGFYDREKLHWKNIQDTMLFTAAAPPGGGRNKVTPRFSRHFNVLCVPPASPAAMTLIFESILGGFCERFDKAIQGMVSGVVAAMLEMYQKISEDLLPTPAKFHYTFNLRDVSKVVQGMLMIKPKRCADSDKFGQLFIHELQRVFCDRLIDETDVLWFTQLTTDLSTRHLRTSWSHADLFEANPILFVDFLKPGLEPEDRLYEHAADMGKVKTLLSNYLDEYNVTFPSTMELVFFTDAVEHVARVARVLRQPRGNAMLIGVGGSGKQSTTRIAAFIADMELRQIEINRGYDLAAFREDMKVIMLVAGVEGKQVCFLFTDTQVVVETQLEDINNILNSGDIPNLWLPDELDKLVNDMIPVLTKLKIPETRDNCIAFFIDRVRQNLHVVLAMSPVGDALRIRCRQFGALISCCTIDKYFPWPKAALISVAERFLGNVELPSEEIRSGIVSLCGTVHMSISGAGERFLAQMRRRTYTTPKSYLDLINLYTSFLGKLQAKVQIQADQMTTGVRKLEETNAVVDGLKEKLKVLEPVLVEKVEYSEKLLTKVAIDSSEAEIVREKVTLEENEVQAQAIEVAEIKADAQADLDKALPALNNAMKALDSLSKADITEVKSFPKPPPAVQLTMEAVNIMLEEKPDWDTAKKKVLSDSNFLGRLKSYDKDNIPAAVLKKITPYIVNEGFQVEVVGKVSSAAKGLCLWVHAMDVYSKVAKEVGPKKARVAEMDGLLQAANTKLAAKQAELQAVVEKVAALQLQCDTTMAEKDSLLAEQATTATRLVNAEKLTNGLASEGVRWKQTLVDLVALQTNLIGDTILSCACISYYGPFTGVFRDELVDQWTREAQMLNLPCSDSFSLMQTLGDPVQIREFQNQSLPTDTVSTNNSLLVTMARRWPLMIDPQGQANKWIKRMQQSNDLEISKMSDPNLLRSLENCIRVGKPLLIEAVEEHIEPALEPVLQRATFKQGNRTLIRLGDSNVDYDDDFRLYMTSKMPNPHYLPEICIKVTVINFTVTLDGLEDQLLGEVVKKERPEIEERKVELLLRMAADSKQLKEIEADILARLSAAKGNILDDQELIDTLANAKQTSTIIKERVEEAKKTEEEINEARAGYLPVATRGSLIYFVIADLANIDPMYQYSLESFRRLFCRCIDDAEKSADIDTRITNLLKYTSEVTYLNICRGLFEKDKLLYSSMVAFAILRNGGTIQPVEWSLFVRGPGTFDKALMPDNPRPKRISPQAWELLYNLEQQVPANPGEESLPFSGLCKSIKEKPAEWDVWLDAADPLATELPDGFADSVSDFQKLIVLRAFREEDLLAGVRAYVASRMGDWAAKSPPTSMETMYDDLDNMTPCVFILSKGADPTGLLLRFAKKMNYSERMSLVSLGQGQGPRAKSLVDAAKKTGDWVMLQNCMLAKSWMTDLERICFQLQDDAISEDPAVKTHPDFRLYLTSKPCDYFPISTLQNSVKMTNEPPAGVRANVLGSYASLVKPEDYETCKMPVAWKKILAGLAFFHANVQERRKFGPLGWNIRYGFDESDLETSVSILRRFLTEQDEVPWDALAFVTGQINYGGRVTDDQDKRCIMSVLKKFINADIMGDKYKFSASGTYYIPTEGKLEDTLEYLRSLPERDAPEIFGMHENANVTFNKAESNYVMTTMLSLQPRATGGGEGGKSSDDVVCELADVLAAQVPEVLDAELAGADTFVIQPNGLLNSLAICLSQEMIKFNRLLDRMRSTLQDVQKAVKGLIVMSSDLDLMYTAFMINAVPQLWTTVSFASLKTLASWIKDLVSRCIFIRGWLLEGQPATFDLPIFFFPQGFMTGTLQTYARKYMVSIDSLQFGYNVLKTNDLEAIAAPEDGVIIYGLWFEGARWDMEKELVQTSVYGEMYTNLPPVHLTPELGHKCLPTSYECPVYKTAVRQGVLSTTGLSTNYVVSVELPTDVDTDTWVLSGAACLCTLSD